MKDKLQHILHWLPLVIYVSLILFFSTGSVPKEIEKYPDILLHTCEYMVLGLFLYYAFVTTFAIEPVKLAFILTGIGMTVGIMDEIIQSYTPSRFASVKDLVVDLVALGLSQIILYYFRKNKIWKVPEPK